MTTLKILGRPTISNEEQRSCRVMVRFTKNELEQIKQRADGISISEVIRDAVLSKNNIERPDRVTKKELIKISQRAAFLAASEAMAKRQNR